MTVLSGLVALSKSVRLYVPSTVSVNQAVDSSGEVELAASLLSQWFGGATVHSALGCWSSPQEGLVKEAVSIVEAFCSEADLEAKLGEVVEYARALKVRMGQEAVAVEVSGSLYLV